MCDFLQSFIFMLTFVDFNHYLQLYTFALIHVVKYLLAINIHVYPRSTHVLVYTRIHIHRNIHIHAYTQTHTRTHTHIHTYTHAHTRTYTHTYIHINTYILYLLN